MKLVKINPSNMSYYSRDFIKGFECGAKRQLEADKRSIPKGHWILKHVETAPKYIIEKFYCSECGEGQVYGMPNYCPSCGADMKGEKTNDEY